MSEPRMVKVMENINQFTVQDLVDWCLQRDLDMTVVKLTGGHLQWERPETEKEKARRDQWEADADRRKENWERETYDRLHAKFANG